ncbi:helix-turn-helix domain-containing protein [Actinoplanes oblitus]|uniref:Helix-turn-helix domain-containing protein n=1 Tax=Actinoplanes oblitus TaxID=3040509 RepID=A0ABY8WVD6_9ACTN|nr:helix-turn-helix domain-containing protein [Actinoplanes oblitus]WIM99975.1 helix-turn-helix domain-containing protein [Actinoplanes oblitus]
MSTQGSRKLQDEILTIDEVANLLKVPVGTLRKWRSAGEAPPGFRLGKYVRFRLSGVERFVADREACADD